MSKLVVPCGNAEKVFGLEHFQHMCTECRFHKPCLYNADAECCPESNGHEWKLWVVDLPCNDVSLQHLGIRGRVQV